MKIQKIYVGVDPGKKGGIVALSAEGVALAAYRMPLLTGGSDYDIPRLAEIIDCPVPGATMNVCRFGVEDVGPMAVFGSKGAEGTKLVATSKSNFALGRGLGLLDAFLSVWKEVERIGIPSWQALYLGAPKTRKGLGTKASSISTALRLFPNLPDLAPWRGATPITDGVADAACLADYVRRLDPANRNR